jgi:hypothetical protein
MSQPQRIVSLTQACIRQFICAECERKPAAAAPAHAGAPGTCEPMPCEPQCELFLLLPRLCDLVQRRCPEPSCDFGLAVRSLLRQARESHAIASEEGDVETNLPLHIHAETTLAVIEHVVNSEV